MPLSPGIFILRLQSELFRYPSLVSPKATFARCYPSRDQFFNYFTTTPIIASRAYHPATHQRIRGNDSASWLRLSWWFRYSIRCCE